MLFVILISSYVMYIMYLVNYCYVMYIMYLVSFTQKYDTMVENALATKGQRKGLVCLTGSFFSLQDPSKDLAVIPSSKTS